MLSVRLILISLFSVCTLEGEEIMEDITELCSKITLDEEEEANLVFDQEDKEKRVPFFTRCLVGSFLTDNTINIQAMKLTLACPVKGVNIKVIALNRFIFQLFHDFDVDRIIKGDPWMFNRYLLLMKEIALGLNPSTFPLYTMNIWIQIYDLPCGLLSERVVQDIGNYLGEFVESDQKKFDGNWRQYLRIQVGLDS